MWLIAYIDPATGSFLLQALAAGLLGALFALKTFWRRIVGFFRRGSSAKADVEHGGVDSD